MYLRASLFYEAETPVQSTCWAPVQIFQPNRQFMPVGQAKKMVKNSRSNSLCLEKPEADRTHQGACVRTKSQSRLYLIDDLRVELKRRVSRCNAVREPCAGRLHPNPIALQCVVLAQNTLLGRQSRCHARCSRGAGRKDQGVGRAVPPLDPSRGSGQLSTLSRHSTSDATRTPAGISLEQPFFGHSAAFASSRSVYLHSCSQFFLILPDKGRVFWSIF